MLALPLLVLLSPLLSVSCSLDLVSSTRDMAVPLVFSVRRPKEGGPINKGALMEEILKKLEEEARLEEEKALAEKAAEDAIKQAKADKANIKPATHFSEAPRWEKEKAAADKLIAAAQTAYDAIKGNEQ